LVFPVDPRSQAETATEEIEAGPLALIVCPFRVALHETTGAATKRHARASEL
jgi:hypothetical protein